MGWGVCVCVCWCVCVCARVRVYVWVWVCARARVREGEMRGRGGHDVCSPRTELRDTVERQVDNHRIGHCLQSSFFVQAEARGGGGV